MAPVRLKNGGLRSGRTGADGTTGVFPLVFAAFVTPNMCTTKVLLHKSVRLGLSLARVYIYIYMVYSMFCSLGTLDGIASILGFCLNLTELPGDVERGQ